MKLSGENMCSLFLNIESSTVYLHTKNGIEKMLHVYCEEKKHLHHHHYNNQRKMRTKDRIVY